VHTVRERVAYFRRGRNREPGLARATGSGERDQPSVGSGQQCHDPGQNLVPPQQGRGL
jgi:hypothetical protein